MFCLISFIFIFIIVGQLEVGVINLGQAITYGAYGLLMFYYTSKPYWSENRKKGGKKA